MTRASWRIIVGLLLVFLGTALLLDRAGIVILSGIIWSSVLLLLGGTAFLSLWRSNPDEWWPLIPGASLVGWALSILLGEMGLPDWLVILIGFAGTSLPFLYVFFQLGSAEGWWALIPAGIIGAWGLAVMLSALGLPDALFLLIGLGGSGLPFLALYLLNRRSNTWALIPGAIMAFLGLVLSLSELVGEDWLPTIVLLGIALAFLAIFLTNRRYWWALIPAGVLAIIALSLSPWSLLQLVLWPALLIVGGVLLLIHGLRHRPSSGPGRAGNA